MRWLSFIVIFLLGGCELFGGGDDDPIESPAELTEFDATLTVRELWSIKVGDGALIQ